MQYVQYNEDGQITASVMTIGSAPDHPRQLAFETPVDIEGKMVDLVTLALIDIPPE